MHDRLDIKVAGVPKNTEKLRIALLSAHSCPVGAIGARDTGGMSVYIRELARELDRTGHSVDIYTRVHDIEDPVIVPIGERARVIHLKDGDEIQVHKLAIYSCLPEMGCNLESFRKSNDLTYDVLFSHYWLSGYLGNYVRMWWKVPHVLMFHTLGAVKNASGSGDDDTDLRIVTEQEVIRDGQRIIASTPREKNDLVKFYGADPVKIGVVPCGVNMETFRPVESAVWPGTDDDVVRLLFVGRIDPIKGIDRLLKALPLVRSEKPVRLLIIGGDEPDLFALEYLRTLVEELGIVGRVEFRKRVPQEQLAAYYSAADLCIVPSYYESFGLVSLESLACGTPVVANDVGQMRSIISQGINGYVTPDNRPETLAEHISLALSRFGRGTTDIQAVRSSVGEYTWSAVAEGIVRELRTALARQSSPVA